MARNFDNWLTAYVAHASCSEAPRIIHFWAGVSAIAGALRRKVWFDQVRFQWYPSFYIIFVGPPAVITKSTTADGSMNLLRSVPGIKFGPNSVTWQKMCETLAGSCETFEYKDQWVPMSAVTFVASELGSLVDLENKGMVDFLIELWDGKKSYEKQTKVSGDDTIEAPWVNLLGCTTPQWIATNMDAMTMGGGFTSRCIFVYGDTKEKKVAYLEDLADPNYADIEAKLLQDLEHIAVNLCGQYRITPEAKAWGTTWYENIWTYEYKASNPPWLNGYIGRKQTHLHKLAMVLAAAQRDELVITLEDLQLAHVFLQQIEPSMERVFALTGKTEDATYIDRFLSVLKAKGEMSYTEAYRALQSYFPDSKKMENVLEALQRGKHMTLANTTAGPVMRYVGD